MITPFIFLVLLGLVFTVVSFFNGRAPWLALACLMYGLALLLSTR